MIKDKKVRGKQKPIKKASIKKGRSKKQASPLLFTQREEIKPVSYLTDHFLKAEPEASQEIKGKFDYLKLYNKIRRQNFGRIVPIYLLTEGINNPSVFKSMVSMIKHFIDTDIFFPHTVEFSADYKRIRVISGKGCGGENIKEAFKYLTQDHRTEFKINPNYA